MLSSPLSVGEEGLVVVADGGQSHSLNFSVGSLGEGGRMHWLLVKTNLQEKYSIFHYSLLAFPGPGILL